MSTDRHAQPDLAAVRAQIDATDEKLIRILGDRAQLALQAKAAKTDGVITHLGREAEVVEHFVTAHTGPLTDEAVRRIAQVIVEECRNLQQYA